MSIYSWRFKYSMNLQVKVLHEPEAEVICKFKYSMNQKQE